MVSQEFHEERTPNPKRQRLHNFTFPTWRSPIVQRCSNDASASTEGSAYGSTEETASSRKRESRRMSKAPASIDGVKDGIEDVRQKLVLDLKKAADKLKNTIFNNEEAEEEEQQNRESPPTVTPVTAEAAVEDVRPWSLRKRQADGKAPDYAGDSGKRLKINEKKPNDSSPATNGGGSAVKLKLRSNAEKTQRSKLSVELSRKEIEEDYMILLGRPPPRRPTKRPKVVQKNLTTIFPGAWLREVTPDLYKVPETSDGKALKGKEKGKLQFFDSDEEP